MPILKLLNAKTFGFGIETSIDPFNVDISTEHSWNKEMANTKSTGVTINLGDENPGDEIVVDLSYDKKYGTVAFKTVSGRTKW